IAAGTGGGSAGVDTRACRGRGAGVNRGGRALGGRRGGTGRVGGGARIGGAVLAERRRAGRGGEDEGQRRGRQQRGDLAMSFDLATHRDLPLDCLNSDLKRRRRAATVDRVARLMTGARPVPASRSY